MSVRQIGHPRPSSRTRSAHVEQNRWCPHGTSAIRGLRGAIRHTSQLSLSVCGVSTWLSVWLSMSTWLSGRWLPSCRPRSSWFTVSCQYWTSLVRRRHWETEHLPSQDRMSGTAFLLPSVICHCRCQSSENCSKLICLFKGRGAGDLWTGALKMYWLTN